MQQVHLSSNWQCKKWTHSLIDENSNTSDWFAASVPGTVQQALLATNQIPDPFYGLNETLVQWVGESDWMYRCTFEHPANVTPEDCVALCFDGLDTFATVWLNGQQIHASDNMFIPYRIQIGSQLQTGKNELLILCESALRHGKEREAIYGKQGVWNGDASRVYVRKAQYHYGWDWGPTLLTAGPWRPVYLEIYHARIANLYCPIEITSDLKDARISVNTTCEVSTIAQLPDMMAHLILYDPNGERIDEHTVPVTTGTAKHIFELKNPQLWWPRGYGEQPLYRVVATLHTDTGGELDWAEQRLGLRHLQLVQQPVDNENGTTFFFEVNNTPVYCGGANWIPADSFLPTIAPERYRAWLQLAADAHMTMLRVWGGASMKMTYFMTHAMNLGCLYGRILCLGVACIPRLSGFKRAFKPKQR